MGAYIKNIQKRMQKGTFLVNLEKRLEYEKNYMDWERKDLNHQIPESPISFAKKNDVIRSIKCIL